MVIVARIRTSHELVGLLGRAYGVLAVKVGAEGGGQQIEQLLAFPWRERQLRVELLCQGAERPLSHGGLHAWYASGAKWRAFCGEVSVKVLWSMGGGSGGGEASGGDLLAPRETFHS